MKILQLTKKVPFPLKDGESIAVTQLAKGLVKLGCDIDLLSFNSIKHHVDYSKSKVGLRHYTIFSEVQLDNRVKLVPAFINLFTKESYNISRFYNNEFKDRLIELLSTNDYDIILIESLFMTVYINVIRKFANVKIVMRSHNIEFKIWERLAYNEKNRIKSYYLSFLAKRLKAYEISMISYYDYIFSISSIDEGWYRRVNSNVNIMTVPTGVDTDSYQESKLHLKSKVSFFFIGSLDWKPNIEGLLWFINNVWKNKTFEARFYIAGRNCPDSLKKFNIKDMFVIGEVEDAHQFIRDHDVMIVPLFSGSGIRIKIIEAMAIGRPIVSTSVGLEGIGAIDGKEVFIADTIQEYESLLGNIINNRDLLFEVSKGAKSFVWNNFHQDIISKNIHSKLISILD